VWTLGILFAGCRQLCLLDRTLSTSWTVLAGETSLERSHVQNCHSRQPRLAISMTATSVFFVAPIQVVRAKSPLPTSLLSIPFRPRHVLLPFSVSIFQLPQATFRAALGSQTGDWNFEFHMFLGEALAERTVPRRRD
jgi:hypothetical protein